MKKLLMVLVFCLSSIFIELYGQELNCQVSVTSKQVEGTDKEVFSNLEKVLKRFMEERVWTNYKFEQNEKIECSMTLNITSYDRGNNKFVGTLTVIMRRPVYKSSYNSTILNTLDNNIEFTYLDGDAVEYNDATFISNMTSLFAFYAYIIIGLDFDTFTSNGGAPFFQQAQTLINNVPSNTAKGWSSFDGTKNRYWLMENLTNSVYSDVHNFLYTYHRLGLDQMSESLEKGRVKVIESLEFLKTVNEKKPGSYIMQLILEAKRDEFIGIFKDAPDHEKMKVIDILKKLDPINASKYQNEINNR